MTSPRTPRQWNQGDEEPYDVEQVRDSKGRIWIRFQQPIPGIREGMWETAPFTGARHGWSVLINELGAHLSEVLPETPEPPREERPTATPRVLLGWTVPSHIEAEIYQGRFWGLCLRCDGERKVTLDYEAEAVAFLKDHGHGQPVEYRPIPGCCGGCGGDGAVSDPDTNGRCPDCYGTGHMHTGSCDPVPASQSFPAVPVSSTGGEDGGEGSSDALRPIRDFIVQAVGFDAGEGMTFQAKELRDALLAEGWRPPLREVMYDAGETAEEAVRRLAAEVVGLRQHLSSPLPDSETEWGHRTPWGAHVRQPSEKAARMLVEHALPGARFLVRREVGPWIEVTS